MTSTYVWLYKVVARDGYTITSWRDRETARIDAARIDGATVTRELCECLKVGDIVHLPDHFYRSAFSYARVVDSGIAEPTERDIWLYERDTERNEVNMHARRAAFDRASQSEPEPEPEPASQSRIEYQSDDSGSVDHAAINRTRDILTAHSLDGAYGYADSKRVTMRYAARQLWRAYLNAEHTV